MCSLFKNDGFFTTDTKSHLLGDRLELARTRRNRPELKSLGLARILLLGAALALNSRCLVLADKLPNVSVRPPVPAGHFPDTAHAVVWRNWQLVEPDRLAVVLGTSTDKVIELAESMGLPPTVRVPREMRERGYITLVRRNWHLLPYEQLLDLLNMSADDLAFRLREDDFSLCQVGRAQAKL